jgi:hypothetical protein
VVSSKSKSFEDSLPSSFVRKRVRWASRDCSKATTLRLL